MFHSQTFVFLRWKTSITYTSSSSIKKTIGTIPFPELSSENVNNNAHTLQKEHITFFQFSELAQTNVIVVDMVIGSRLLTVGSGQVSHKGFLSTTASVESAREN